MRSRSVLLLSAIVLSGHAYAADVPAFHGAADCRIAPLKPAPRDNDISWNGPCKNGYADGRGTLTWRAQDNTEWTLEGTLARGAIAGEATRRSGKAIYTGTFRNGVPHGTGYFRYADGDQYEGGVVDGLREGPGLLVHRDGSSYEGYWKQDRRNGYGKAVFSTGGSYEGQWRDDSFHGRGKIVYAGSGRIDEGEFIAGGAHGNAPPTIEKGAYKLKAELPAVGTNILATRVVSPLPPDANWQTLTEPQRNLVRSWYPALEDGDEPPYPLKGKRGLLKALAEVYQRFADHQGTVLLLVTVGADGTPETAKAIDAPDAELGRYLAMAAMVQRFKPARCRGQPCPMIYPLKLELARVN